MHVSGATEMDNTPNSPGGAKPCHAVYASLVVNLSWSFAKVR